MANERLTYLFYQHFKRASSAPEQEELMELVKQPEHEAVLRGLIEATWDMPHAEFEQPDVRAGEIYDFIIGQRVVKRQFLTTAWLRYAAVLLIIAGTAIFLYKANQKPQKETVQKMPSTEILPGSDKAILTLAGGEEIQLDSSANAYLAQKGIMNSHSALHYSNPSEIAALNTLTTPRGGQYKLQLNDGTVVWLNAASSITYPATFTEAERNVTITGEAYFEVAKNAAKPFIVKTAKEAITVLGTSFNVNAYSDEEGMVTTLLEGSIQVNSGAEKAFLKPGQQVTVSNNIEIIKDADTRKATAWKNGWFQFSSAGVKEVMRQLARWYDIDVVYESTVPAMTFEGTIPRTLPLSEMLDVLKRGELKYRQEGRTLIILP